MATFNGSSSYTYYLKLIASEDSYSVINRNSSVSWSLYICNGSSRFADHLSTFNVAVDGTPVFSTGSTEVDILAFNTTTLLCNGVTTVPHNADGSKTLTVSAAFRTNSIVSSPYHTPQTTITVSGSFALTKLNYVPVNGQYYFDIENGSFTSIDYTSVRNANGTYTVAVNQKLFTNLAINSKPSSLYCSISPNTGGTALATSAVVTPVVNQAESTTTTLWPYTLTIGPFTTRTPVIMINTYATISGVGTSAAVLAGLALDPIPVPTLNATTVAHIENTPTAIRSSDGITMSINAGTDTSFYKLNLTYLYKDTGEVRTIDGVYGVNNVTQLLSGLWPNSGYTYDCAVIGKDNPVPILYNKVMAITNDIYPKTITVMPTASTINSVTLSALTTFQDVFTHTDLIYIYKKKVGTIWTTMHTTLATLSTTATSYTYTGLDADTVYEFMVTVKNSLNYETNSAVLTVTTPNDVPAFALTNPFTFVTTPSSIQVIVNNAAAYVGSLHYSFSLDTGVTWTAQQLSNIYTFTALSVATPYYIKVRLYDDAVPQQCTESSSSVVLTKATAPVISAIKVLKKTGTSARINIATSNSGNIIGYKYSVVPTGSPVSYSSLKNVSSYSITGLSPLTNYDVAVQVIDSQGIIVSSNMTYPSFTTSAISPFDDLVKAKFVRILSTDLGTIPLVDGTVIITTDTGKIYLDVFNGATVDRVLIGKDV